MACLSPEIGCHHGLSFSKSRCHHGLSLSKERDELCLSLSKETMSSWLILLSFRAKLSSSSRLFSSCLFSLLFSFFFSGLFVSLFVLASLCSLPFPHYCLCSWCIPQIKSLIQLLRAKRSFGWSSFIPINTRVRFSGSQSITSPPSSLDWFTLFILTRLWPLSLS